MKTAVLVGATGLIGNELLRRIADDAHYEKLTVLVRRKIRVKHLHTTVHVVDFDKPETYTHLIKGNDFFCTLGSTIKNAGSKENFRKIDYDLVLKLAEIASSNGVENFILVSSLGANAASSNFYLRTKGELERAVTRLPFKKTIVVRPSILLGNRNEFRMGEKIGIGIARAMSIFMIGRMKKYKPIQAKAVAKAMIHFANYPQKKIFFESDSLLKFS